MTVMTGRSYCAAVAYSCEFMRKSPSPAMHTTVRWIEALDANRCRHAVTHRARCRGDVLGESAEAKKAVNPGGEIPRAVAQDRILGEVLAQPHHHGAEIDAARLLGRLLGPCEIVRMGGFRSGFPFD